jgi:hypothetical protein
MPVMALLAIFRTDENLLDLGHPVAGRLGSLSVGFLRHGPSVMEGIHTDDKRQQRADRQFVYQSHVALSDRLPLTGFNPACIRQNEN